MESFISIINQNGAITGLIGVLIGFYVNTLNSNRQIRANLKSKARIEWIQSVRKLSTEYISVCLEYMQILKRSINIRTDDEMIEFNNELRDKMNEINKYKYLLIMHFGTKKNKRYIIFKRQVKNKENEKMIEEIKRLFNQVCIHEKIYLKQDREPTEEENRNVKLYQFVELFSDYFKKEWDKAKNNK